MFHIFVSQQTSRPDKFIGTAFEKDRTKPARASAFIGVSILSGADAPEGIVIPARASTFNCIETVQNADLRALRSNGINVLMNAEAFADFVSKGP